MKVSPPLRVHKPYKLFHTLLNHILRGAVVTTPLVFTLVAILWLFNSIDRFLPNVLQNILDLLSGEKIKMPYIPGIGLITVLLVLTLVGYISRFFIFSRFMKMLDTYLEKAPGVKIIYSTLKDLITNLGGSKKKFDKPVLVCVDEYRKIYKMGFITNKHLDALLVDNFIAVYIPMSFSIAGNLYFVHQKDIITLDGIDSSMAMKFIISGGVTDLDKKKHTSTEPPHE